MSDSLSSTLQQERIRARKILTEYEKLGSAGAFGAALIKASIKQAETSEASGDVVAILVACRDLKDIS